MSDIHTQYSVPLPNVSNDFLRFLLREEQLKEMYDSCELDYNFFERDDNPHDFGEWEIWRCRTSGEITVHLYADDCEPTMEAVNRVIQKYILHEADLRQSYIEYVSVSYGSRAIPDYQGATVYVVDANDIRCISSCKVANLLWEGKI